MGQVQRLPVTIPNVLDQTGPTARSYTVPALLGWTLGCSVSGGMCCVFALTLEPLAPTAELDTDALASASGWVFPVTLQVLRTALGNSVHSTYRMPRRTSCRAACLVTFVFTSMNYGRLVAPLTLDRWKGHHVVG